MSLPPLRSWRQRREAVQLLLRGATLRTCAPIAVVVGTLLSVSNQGDVLVAGTADERVAGKVAANLVILFLTSSIGALLAVRAPAQGTRQMAGR